MIRSMRNGSKLLHRFRVPESTCFGAFGNHQNSSTFSLLSPFSLIDQATQKGHKLSLLPFSLLCFSLSLSLSLSTLASSAATALIMDDFKRSGHIPAFGNWDYANDLPITQYFESARQAGLLRYTGDTDLYVATALYDDGFKKSAPTVVPQRKTRAKERERRCPHVKEQKKQGKVCDVTGPPSKRPSQKLRRNDAVPLPKPAPPIRPPKAVDEDLYKIPPELLQNSKRKKMLGFFSRCLVPACSV